MKAVQLATVSPDLDLVVLDRVFGGVEAALADLGAGRVWVDVDGLSFAVIAELPDDIVDGTRRTHGTASGSC